MLFRSGWAKREITFEVINNSLRLGVTGSSNNLYQWWSADNFKLTYNGKSITTGNEIINGLEGSELKVIVNNRKVSVSDAIGFTIYTIHGSLVAICQADESIEVPQGFYVVKSGGKALKIMVK